VLGGKGFGPPCSKEGESVSRAVQLTVLEDSVKGDHFVKGRVQADKAKHASTDFTMTGVRRCVGRDSRRSSNGVSKSEFGVVEVGRKLGRMEKADPGALNGDERGRVGGVEKEVLR